MDDARDKPNPQGFIHLATKLCRNKLVKGNIPIAYIYKTIAI